MKIPFLIGRTVFGGFFLYNGIHHFLKRNQMKPYVAAKGVPMPDLAVTLSGAAFDRGKREHPARSQTETRSGGGGGIPRHGLARDARFLECSGRTADERDDQLHEEYGSAGSRAGVARDGRALARFGPDL